LGTQCDGHNSVDQLDLGPSRAAYVWRMTGGSVYGTGIAWELRAAARSGGASTLLDSGLISGTCGFRLPSAPVAATTPIAYLDAGSPCDTSETRFATVDPVTGTRAFAATPAGLVAGAVRDGATIYWLRASSSLNSDSAAIPPGAATCRQAAAKCELVATTPLPSYGDESARRVYPPGDVDLVRSDTGYRWSDGPGGVQLLRPPAHEPCAPSRSAAPIYVSARWSRGKHKIEVYRRDPGQAARRVGITITRSLSSGTFIASPRLTACGRRTTLVYVVTTGTRVSRVSFAVARNPPVR
jgi:hypothetical protein